jgi:hypothetical protein
MNIFINQVSLKFFTVNRGEKFFARGNRNNCNEKMPR